MRKPGRRYFVCRDDTIRIEIPAEHAEFALRRIRDLKHACIYSPNFLDTLMLSCYQQGLLDALQVAKTHPEIRKLVAA